MDHWYENEDWDVAVGREKLQAVGEGEYQALVDLPGPGAATRYHFFARLETGADNPLREVELLEEPGTFELDIQPVEVAGTPPEYQWVSLGSLVHRRRYVPMVLRGEPGLPGLHSLWVSEVPRYLLGGRVERRLALPYPEPLSGVPLGGAGAGKLELCRDGRFRNFTLNGNLDLPVYNSEGTFLAVWAQQAGGADKTGEPAAGFILSSESLHGLPAAGALEFEGRYPRASVRTNEASLPVQVELSASGTIIPRNLQDTSLPLALFRVRLTNPGDQPLRVTVAFSAENLLGCGGAVVPPAQWREEGKGYYEGWEEREGNREEAWRSAGWSGVLLRGEDKREKRSEGRYVVAAEGEWRGGSWRLEEGREVWRRFLERGELPGCAGLASEGEATAGALSQRMELGPQETVELRLLWAWYVPEFWETERLDYGHYYANYWASAEEVAVYGAREFERLWQEAGEVPELLRESSLPEWFGRALANDAYVLSTNCWVTRDGRFSVNESPKNMFGCMGTLDQKLYGSHYYSLFFPDWDKSELLQFAHAQAEDGGIEHDLGYGHLEQKQRTAGWPDLSSSLTIQTLKLYQLTGDTAFLEEMYPSCVQALLEWQLGRDSDGDGIANISGVGNTFDSEKFEGTSAYIATVWLAALRCLEEMARRKGDLETEARSRKLFDKARASAIAELWNGAYFANYYDVTHGLRNDNSHFSQLAGEFFTLLLGLGQCYGQEYVPAAQESLLRLNYPADLVMPTNEATPEGRLPRRDMWGWLPHGRVYLGGLSFFLDQSEAGLEAMERMERALSEVNHDNRWDQRLFYEPDTGREHWGTFYMTAPASWYCYQALLGVLWDLPEGKLGLCPHLPPSLLPFAGPVFLPDVWGWLSVSADGQEMTWRKVKEFGRSLPVRSLRLPEQKGELEITVEGERLPVQATVAGPGWVEYACELDLAQVQEMEIRWRE